MPIGTLCIFDPDERAVEPNTMEVIAELANAAVDVLEARRQHEEIQGSLADMTDRQRELRRSNEHLAAFAGQVSHDIQGPLATVVMALQLLDDDLDEDVAPVPEHRRMFLHNALSGAQRMRSTVTGLMDFAVVGGRLTPVRLKMNGIVEDVLHDLSARMGRTRVDGRTSCPTVWGDDVQVRAVTQNLVANALKYAGHVRGPRHPDQWASTPGDRARICVSDNGPGHPRGPAGVDLRPAGPRRGGRAVRRRGSRHRPGHLSRGSSRRTAARSACATRRAAARSSGSSCPVAEAETS